MYLTGGKFADRRLVSLVGGVGKRRSGGVSRDTLAGKEGERKGMAGEHVVVEDYRKAGLFILYI